MNQIIAVLLSILALFTTGYFKGKKNEKAKHDNEEKRRREQEQASAVQAMHREINRSSLPDPDVLDRLRNASHKNNR